jgi:hypothetical protein
LSIRHFVLACSCAIALGGAAAWAVAQQSGTASQPAAAAPHAAPPAAAPGAKAPSAPVQTPAAKPAKTEKPLWRDLTPAQHAALDPLAGEWDQMDAVRKRKWLEMANHFATMKPEEQQRVHERMREWVRLTPAQRKLARDTYARTKKLAPGEKAATWESYQQLPDDQKQKLAEAAAARKQGAAAVPPHQRPITPLRKDSTACPAGTVKNKVSATPPCVPGVPAAAATASSPPATPAAPAAPASNAQ